MDQSSQCRRKISCRIRRNQCCYVSDHASSYIEKLEALDTYANKSIATIPASQQVLVTAHDAFSYMARAYGLEVLGIQGLSTESEAGGQRPSRTSSPSSSIKRSPLSLSKVPSLIKTFELWWKAPGARDHQIKIGGELFSDAMGPAGTYEGTYIGMIDHNVTIITRALGGMPRKRTQRKIETQFSLTRGEHAH